MFYLWEWKESKDSCFLIFRSIPSLNFHLQSGGMHHRKGCTAMNKQVTFEKTINILSTGLYITDFLFRKKIMLQIQECSFIVIFFSCPRYIFPTASIASSIMCLKHITLFMIIWVVKIYFPVMEPSQLIYFTLVLGRRERW